jgi:hypothetical protein
MFFFLLFCAQLQCLENLTKWMPSYIYIYIYIYKRPIYIYIYMGSLQTPYHENDIDTHALGSKIKVTVALVVIFFSTKKMRFIFRRI